MSDSSSAILSDVVANAQKVLDQAKALQDQMANDSQTSVQVPDGHVIVDAGAMDTLKTQLDKLTSERDALRAAVQVEIDDAKADTTRLEQALAPVEAAPAPVIPEPVQPAPVPVQDDAGKEAEGGSQPVEQPAPAPVVEQPAPAPAPADGGAATEVVPAPAPEASQP